MTTHPMFQKILVGVDGSDAAKHALDQALDLAALTDGTVHAISVEEHLPAYAATVGEADEQKQLANQYFRVLYADVQRIAAAKDMMVMYKVVPGHAVDVLVHQATIGAYDLIVLGHTGHSRLHTVFLGSTANRVTELAPCAVLIVR